MNAPEHVQPKGGAAMDGLCSNCGRLRKLVYDRWGDEWVCIECLNGEQELPNFPDKQEDVPEAERFVKSANRSHR